MTKDCGCIYWKTVANGQLVCRCGENGLSQKEYDRMMKKRLKPAHEGVIDLLSSSTTGVNKFLALCRLYEMGIEVPKTDLPRLADAFTKARERISRGLSHENSIAFGHKTHGISTLLLNHVNRK